MTIASVNGVELEVEAVGVGEPVLLISPVLADGFAPLLESRQLSERHALVHYHKRGWVGSSPTPDPVSVEEHAADALALLDHFGFERAHVAGHSSGAAVAVELALAAPERVQSLVLLELSLLSLPEGQAFLQQAGPVFQAYASGDHEGALSAFLSAVSGLAWPECRRLLDARIPGALEQSLRDADTFFGVELPALAAWSLAPERARRIEAPTLSVLGARTLPLWVEVDRMLQATLPRVERCLVDGAGHLLHIEQPEPVARGIADFLGRHPMPRGRARTGVARPASVGQHADR